MFSIKKQSKRIVLIEEKVRDIEVRLQISPRKSLRRLAQETGGLLGSAFIAKKKKRIKFRPCKITVVQELKEPDYAARIVFATNVHNGIMNPQLLFMTDEAWFHVSGHANAQNVRLWSDEYPHAMQVPLHSSITVQVHKKADKTICSNYRAISLGFCIRQILEKMESVRREALYNILTEFGVPMKIVILI
ncbi:hypothetical protein B7P43_G07154 [Cryptotermes secundus]|uniref:Uncharacterized protein n=1 Tax=Cryptotermes secundus TaxID=105785 RepID=A0A2J7Q2C8_9NEOP|nr:hypothetical protein B7P43_G07154 [Cryptotermes secundus]